MSTIYQNNLKSLRDSAKRELARALKACWQQYANPVVYCTTGEPPALVRVEIKARYLSIGANPDPKLLEAGLDNDGEVYLRVSWTDNQEEPEVHNTETVALDVLHTESIASLADDIGARFSFNPEP